MSPREKLSLNRIAYLTSGAANMYCGSCLHDNTLARALTSKGVETLLVPTYTPIRTDEEDVSIDQVFFGGINVYLQQKIPLFRYLPLFLDRVFDVPWLLRKATNRGLNINPRALGALTLSMLKGKNGNQRKEVKRLTNWLSKDIQPDVVILSNLLIGGCIPAIQQLGIPVIVTLQGDDIFLQDLIEPFKSQSLDVICDLAKQVDGFIVHSEYYKEYMQNLFQIPEGKIQVVPLGMDVENTLPGKPRSLASPPTIGYLARMSKEKGLHVLVDAFIKLKQMPDMEDVQLHMAGWRGSTNKEFAELELAKLDAAGLADCYTDFGTVDAEGKRTLLAGLDLLCVPTVHQEPKGLFALEALAAGVPVVLPDHGAFPEMLASLQGGYLFEPENSTVLAQVWQERLTDRSELLQRGAEGRIQMQSQRNAGKMANETIDAIRKLLS